MSSLVFAIAEVHSKYPKFASYYFTSPLVLCPTISWTQKSFEAFLFPLKYMHIFSHFQDMSCFILSRIQTLK